jgi:hypothetical protein
MYIFEYNPPIELHDELNPALWDGEEIRRQIQVKLLQIGREFYDFLGVSAPIEDVLITGSQANYVYTKWSDIDLHLVIDYNKVKYDGDVKKLFDAKRKEWKRMYPLKLKGIPVELYAENSNEPAVTSTYSLLSNQWLKKPAPPLKTYDYDGVKNLAYQWEIVIKRAVDLNELPVLEKIKTMLSMFRRKSLARDGEFGTGNLAFKALRNSGHIADLINAVEDLESSNGIR